MVIYINKINKINKIIERIEELRKLNYSVEYNIVNSGFEIEDIDNSLFSALQTIREEFSVGIEICIVCEFDCNDERLNVSFYNI